MEKALIGLTTSRTTTDKDIELAQERMYPDPHTQALLDRALLTLVPQMKDMDLSRQPTYKGRKMMPLGEFRRPVPAGGVQCTRMIYLGNDGNFYVEGPHGRRGFIVITIRPYGIEHARGEDGISIQDIAEMVTSRLT